MIAMLRSTVHMAFMFVTVIPYSLLILLVRLLGTKGDKLYVIAQKWLTLSVDAARVIMGIRYEIQGQEKLKAVRRIGGLLQAPQRSPQRRV